MKDIQIIEKVINGLSTDELINFDGLDTAQKITGSSYKDDKFTSSLGMAITMEANKILTKRLEKDGDTYNRTTIPQFQLYLKEEGFVEIYKKSFEKERDYTFTKNDGTHGSLKVKEITFFYVYWNYELNAMVYFTTYSDIDVDVDDQIVYNDQTINSGSFLYTIRLKDDSIKPDCYILSSSSYDILSDTIQGSHDIRTGWRRTLNNLKEYYTFEEWRGSQFLWMLHYLQHPPGEEYDYNAINTEVIKAFPQEVKKVITGRYINSPESMESIKDLLIFYYHSFDELLNIYKGNIAGQAEWFEDFKKIENSPEEMDKLTPNNSKLFNKTVKSYRKLKKDNV